MKTEVSVQCQSGDGVVSILGDHVKKGGRYWHTACYFAEQLEDATRQVRLEEQERYMGILNAQEERYQASLKQVQSAKSGVTVVQATGEAQTIDKEKWERGVWEVGQIVKANYGLGVTLPMVYFLIEQLNKRGLVVKFIEVAAEPEMDPEETKRRSDDILSQLAKLKPKEG